MEMEWKFNKNAEICIDDFWYDLAWGGYIKPAKVLTDEKQVEQLEATIELVRSFEGAIYERNNRWQ